MKLSIEYCNVWNYLPRAASLASTILKKYGTSVSSLKLIPSSGVVFSKKNEGRFPEENEIINALENFS